MKIEKNAERIGKNVTISEKMVVLHSVMLSGEPLQEKLKVEFLKGDGPDILVQTTLMSQPFDKRETKTWDLAAIAIGDFNGDRLKELRNYAGELFPDVTKPMITFRTIIQHESESVFQPAPPRKARVEAQVVHSRVRQN